MKARILIAFILAAVSAFASAPAAHALPHGELYVQITVQGEVYRFGSGEIEFSPDLASQLSKRAAFDEKGRMLSFDGTKAFSYSLKDMDEKLEGIAERYYIPPVPSVASFNPDAPKGRMFACTKDVKGVRLNIEKLKEQIESRLKQGLSCDISAAPEPFSAELSEAKIKRSFSLRAQFSTRFDASTLERKHNIALSASKFNGLTLLPGDQVSFNRATGARSAENGYRKAKIIVNGQMTDGVGGGVCQTSTTLYNALLLAGVRIDEYHRHSLAVAYVPPSFDAMVNSGWADLRFTNDTGNMLYLRTFTDDGSLTVQVYGEKLPYTLRRRSEVLETTEAPPVKFVDDPKHADKVFYEDEVFIISASKQGLTSEGWLEYVENGKVIKSVKVRKDKYAPMAGTAVKGKHPRRQSPPALTAD